MPHVDLGANIPFQNPLVKNRLQEWFFSQRNRDVLYARLAVALENEGMSSEELKSVPLSRIIRIMARVMSSFKDKAYILDPHLTNVYFQAMNEMLFSEAYNDIVLTLRLQRQHLHDLRDPQTILPYATSTRSRRIDGVCDSLAPMPTNPEYWKIFQPIY